MDEKVPVPEEVIKVNMSIASVVRNMRKRKGLTQAKISEISGVSVGSVKRFEKTGNISLTSLSRLIIALGMEAELLRILCDMKLSIRRFQDNASK